MAFMLKPTYFTICARNYLGYALTLGRSLKAADPDARFLIFLADDPLSENDQARVEFETVPVRDLELPDFEDMRVRYSIMEFSTAIKPACFDYVFERLGSESAVYLDPDILVLRPLSHVEGALEAGAEIVLTPHSTAPLDDGRDPDDLRLLRTGTYNLGFVAFRKTGAVQDFLEWWMARLTRDCRVDLDAGIFVDQKWMDLAPSYIPNTHVLRHSGYNAAYWNLASRPICGSGMDWKAGDEPLHFYHFSGVVPGDKTVFSKHQDRFQVDDIGPLRTLLNDYLDRLDSNDHRYWAGIPYAFALPGAHGSLDLIMRQVYIRARCQDPDLHYAGREEFYELCNSPITDIENRLDYHFSRLAYEVWAQRSDLRKVFDLETRNGQAAYRYWFLSNGIREHEIPPSLAEPFHQPLSDQHGSEPSVPRLTLAQRALERIVRQRRRLRPLLRTLPEPVLNSVKRRVQAYLRPRIPPQVRHSEQTFAVLEREFLHNKTGVYGYFNAENGLGRAVRNEFRALQDAGANVEARTINPGRSFSNSVELDFPLETKPDNSRIHLVHVNADQTTCSLEWAPSELFHPSRYRIGFWAWELEHFPGAWSSAIDKVDEIWVPSQFVADAICDVTDKPVFVFPHCLDLPGDTSLDMKQIARRHFRLPERAPLFLTMFDFRSFSTRKNPRAVIEAYRRARSAGGKLELVIKTHGAEHASGEYQDLKNLTSDLDGIHLINDVLSEDDIEMLYRACDGVVSLHRSEGFGLTIAEGMAYGLPVVATHYSGVVDFFDDQVGCPVDYELIKVNAGQYPHANGSRWAVPDVEQAAQWLTRLSSDPGLRLTLGQKARARIAEKLSPKVVGQAMAARLDDIHAFLEQKDRLPKQKSPQDQKAA